MWAETVGILRKKVFQFCEIPGPLFRSIHCEGHSKTSGLCFLRLTIVDFEVCLGSFIIWETTILPIFDRWWYLLPEFVGISFNPSFCHWLQPQSMLDPCPILKQVFSSINSAPFALQTYLSQQPKFSVLTSSVHKTVLLWMRNFAVKMQERFSSHSSFMKAILVTYIGSLFHWNCGFSNPMSSHFWSFSCTPRHYLHLLFWRLWF